MQRPLGNTSRRHRDRPVGVYGDLYWGAAGQAGLSAVVDDWAGTALRFSASAPGVGTAIVGTSSIEHLDEWPGDV